MRSRALFWTFSRALFVVHGQKIRKMFTGTFRGSRAHFPQKSQNCRNLRVHVHFSQVHAQFFLKMFTGTFEVHGHFFGFTGTFLSSRARFFSKVHGQLQDVHGHFYEIVQGHFFNVHGEIPCEDIARTAPKLLSKHPVPFCLPTVLAFWGFYYQKTECFEETRESSIPTLC